MGPVSVHAWPGQQAPAQRLAAQLGVPAHEIAVHPFPDGESLVTAHPVSGTVIVYASLHDPNAKLIELMLAAAALRDGGARRLVLIAPYLCYMRQDTAFHEGEAVSQRVVGKFLAERFDRIFTVDPHLHRTASIGAVFPGVDAVALSAAPAVADLLARDEAPADTVIVGPDSEARQWVEIVAAPLGLDFIVAEKVRRGDRSVSISLPAETELRGRPAVIVDDVVSSGGTVAECARALRAAGTRDIQAVAVHALFGETDARHMQEAGVATIRSSDSVPHPTNAIRLAPLLADALKSEAG